LPKTSIQKELEKEQEEITTEIEKRIKEFEKKKTIIKFQYDEMKKKGQIETGNVNVGWAAGFAYEIYGELIALYGAFGEIIGAIAELENENAKISGEWKKHKKILNKFKTAMDFTEEMLSNNK
jgi:hypothetical protein